MRRPALNGLINSEAIEAIRRLLRSARGVCWHFIKSCPLRGEIIQARHFCSCQMQLNTLKLMTLDFNRGFNATNVYETVSTVSLEAMILTVTIFRPETPG